jgi:hypothetical protein
VPSPGNVSTDAAGAAAGALVGYLLLADGIAYLRNPLRRKLASAMILLGLAAAVFYGLYQMLPQGDTVTLVPGQAPTPVQNVSSRPSRPEGCGTRPWSSSRRCAEKLQDRWQQLGAGHPGYVLRLPRRERHHRESSGLLPRVLPDLLNHPGSHLRDELHGSPDSPA